MIFDECPIAYDHNDDIDECAVCGWGAVPEPKPALGPRDMSMMTGPERIREACARLSGAYAPQFRVTLCGERGVRMTKTMAEIIAEAARTSDAAHWPEAAEIALTAAGFGLVADAKAEAWDEGHERGFWNGRMSQLTVPYDAPDPLIGKQDAEANNPYRKASNDGS